jgi:uncharacterized protein YkwD
MALFNQNPLLFLAINLIWFLPAFVGDGAPEWLAAVEEESITAVSRLDNGQRLISLINQIRQKKGLRSLKPSRLVGEVARAHSQAMCAGSFFSHVDPDGSGPKERLARAGYVWKAFGENIGCGQDSPGKVLDTWMRSASHRETILEPAYSEIGIGLVRGGECRIYWTALFVRPRGW